MTTSRIPRGPGAPVALVTGASRGLGRALTHALARRGWHVVIDARDPAALADAAAQMPGHVVTAVPGDVAEPSHRALLAAAVRRLGRLDLLVNNASTLGPVPLPPLAELPPETLRHIIDVNVVAPLALSQMALPLLAARRGAIVAVSSDAAVGSYAGWGGYGASKAALDHLSATLGVENPAVRVYAVDPGEMATDMLRAAMPGERADAWPPPERVVPALLRLIEGDLPSGRYRAADPIAVVGS